MAGEHLWRIEARSDRAQPLSATRPIGPVVHAGIGASCIECTGRTRRGPHSSNRGRSPLGGAHRLGRDGRHARRSAGCPCTGRRARRWCSCRHRRPASRTARGAGLLLVAEPGEEATAAALLDLGRTGDLHRPGARRGLVADDRRCTDHRRAHAHFFLWHASAFPARSIEPRIPPRANVVRCRIINASPSSEPAAESRPSGTPSRPVAGTRYPWKSPKERLSNPADSFKPLAAGAILIPRISHLTESPVRETGQRG